MATRVFQKSLLVLVLLGSMSMATAATVDAARAPNVKEKKAIKRAAMRDCNRSQNVAGYNCEWRGHIRVSTINRRYAYARVSGPAYDNSGILKKSKRKKRWHVVAVVGGGIQPCSHWYREAPRRIVHEFRIRGFRAKSGNFDYHRC